MKVVFPKPCRQAGEQSPPPARRPGCLKGTSRACPALTPPDPAPRPGGESPFGAPARTSPAAGAGSRQPRSAPRWAGTGVWNLLVPPREPTWPGAAHPSARAPPRGRCRGVLGDAGALPGPAAACAHVHEGPVRGLAGSCPTCRAPSGTRSHRVLVCGTGPSRPPLGLQSGVTPHGAPGAQGSGATCPGSRKLLPGPARDRGRLGGTWGPG